MSILDINSLLSTIPSYPVNNRPGSVDPFVKSPPPQPENRDRFTRGEFWRNQAVAQGSTSEEQKAANVYNRSDIAPRVRPSQVEIAPSTAQDVKSVQQDPGETPSDESVPVEEAQGQDVSTKPTGEPLSQSEKAVVESLKKADQAVRAHEMAHLAAAGGFAKGGASFKLQKGPDGKSYAVGGEVQIDMSKGSSPEMTLQKMRTVRRAALAPVDPSPQDQKVAAQATINIAQAAQELNLSKAQQAQPQVVQDDQSAAGQDRLSAGDVYKDYGQSFAQENAEQKTVPVSKQHIASYAQAAAFSREGSGESALEIIA